MVWELLCFDRSDLFKRFAASSNISASGSHSFGGYVMITKASFKLTLFGFVVEVYHFAFFSLVMGLLMGLTTKPDLEQIERSRTF